MWSACGAKPSKTRNTAESIISQQTGAIDSTGLLHCQKIYSLTTVQKYEIDATEQKTVKFNYWNVDTEENCSLLWDID